MPLDIVIIYSYSDISILFSYQSKSYSLIVFIVIINVPLLSWTSMPFVVGGGQNLLGSLNSPQEKITSTVKLFRVAIGGKIFMDWVLNLIYF